MGYAEIPRHNSDLVAPVRTVNAQGKGPFAIVADHASNRIPARWGDLGLSPADRVRHIAWDPGALAVSLKLVDLLDAPLVHSTVSRLVIDCNRDLDAPDLVPKRSELTEIPGNAAPDADDVSWRIATAHAPFHDAIERLLAARRSVLLQPYLERVDAQGETALIHFDGTFSHAIGKAALLQRGSAPTRALFAPEKIERRVPEADERALATRVLAGLPCAPPLYARVDLIRDAAGAPCVLELELTEPSLFFGYASGAAERFVTALAARL